MHSYVTDTEGTETVKPLDYTKLLRRGVQEWKSVSLRQVAEGTVDQSNDHISNYVRCFLFYIDWLILSPSLSKII